MKIKNSPILLIAFIIPFLAIISCKKEQLATSLEQMHANDLKLASMIQSFKARGSSHLKSTAEMSTDSAIWYIGATANFTYGDATRETERTWTDSCFVTLPVNNGKIAESEVYNKYEAIIDSLRTIYQGKNEQNKQLLAVSVETHSLSTNSLVCKVTGIFACGMIPNNMPCTFNNIDSYCFWYLWQNHAICAGPNTASTAVTDAAEETQKRIMWCKGVPAGNYWYEDPIVTVIINDPTQYPVIPGASKSNFHYAKLYWNSSQYSNFNGCIPPADLNFYLTKTKELINNETTQGGLRPAGYSLIDIDMWGFILQGNHTEYMHRATVRYGILHFSIDPPDPLD